MDEDIDAIAKSRETIMKDVHREASKGDKLCAALISLELEYEPFLCLQNYDTDDLSDIDDIGPF